MEDLKDLEVKPFETVDGGDYRNINISGIGKIKSNINTEVLEVNGLGTIFGDIEAESIMVSGSLTAEKDVTATYIFNSKGISNLNKNLVCDELLVQGNLSVKGNIKFTNAKLRGMFASRGILTGDNFDLLGTVDIAGEIRVDNIKVYFKEKSSIKGIICDDLEIVTDKEIKTGLLDKFKSKNILKCNEIIGKKIYIENVECKFISGDEVIIGDNCKIEKVEYKSKFEFTKTSEVKEFVCKK